MPIYEYECRSCGNQFEALVRPPEVPTCPACKSADLEKMLSMFAVSSESTRQAALQDGRARGSRLKKEKDIAQLEYEKHHAH